MAFHVFFSNILLMNYLIAILSTTYENMKETGIFKYKVNLYQYCERYMISFNDRSYGELVLHAPPLSYMTIILFPFLFSEKAMMKISKWFSYLMFWIENVVLLMMFLSIEIAFLMLPAYIKIWYNIIKISNGIL